MEEVIAGNWRNLIRPRGVERGSRSSETYGKFVVRPLERGFGITLGNSLRRVLLSSLQGAAGKAKLLIVAFDDEKGEKLEVLEHPLIAKHHDKIAFVKFPYEKGSDRVKEWLVRSSPTVILCDPASDNPAKRPIQKLTGQRSMSSYRVAILKALAKLEKPKK